MKKQVTEDEPEVRIPEGRLCVYRFPNGRRCRMRRWGAELCFHHDPAAAEKRKNRARGFSRLGLMTATEVHELLTRTLRRLEAGEISPGEAYARGYLAQLLLGNLKGVREEFETARTAWDRHAEMVSRVRALTEPTPLHVQNAGGALAARGEESAE